MVYPKESARKGEDMFDCMREAAVLALAILVFSVGPLALVIWLEVSGTVRVPDVFALLAVFWLLTAGMLICRWLFRW